MIAWHKLCRKWEEGGLEIKDIKTFNYALLLKLVWYIAEGSDRLWVHILIAKYCPRGGIWAANTNRGGSKLWRAIQELKGFFKDTIKWHIGDGSAIAALNQPWYQEWHRSRITTNIQRDARVSQLYDHNLNQWRTDKIRELMGPQAVLVITQTVPAPKYQPAIPDKLIWIASTRGIYTTKEGYNLMHKLKMQQVNYSQAQLIMWKRLWGWKGILPRVKNFLWRAIHEGISTQMAMHRRIRSIKPTCQRCGRENEFNMHTFFFCPAARATWCASQFPILVERLPLNFTSALQVLTEAINKEQIPSFCNIIWNLWKARNEEIFRGTKAMPLITLARARALEYTPTNQENQQQQKPTEENGPVLVQAGTRCIQIDGSWDVSRASGTGMVLYNTQGVLEKVRGTYLMAQDPLEVEAVALNQVLEEEIRGQDAYMILTDSKILTQAIQEGRIDKVKSWKAAQVIANSIQRIQQLGARIAVQHVARKHVTQAHNLANWARKLKTVLHGYPSEEFKERMGIGNIIDKATVTIEE